MKTLAKTSLKMAAAILMAAAFYGVVMEPHTDVWTGGDIPAMTGAPYPLWETERDGLSGGGETPEPKDDASHADALTQAVTSGIVEGVRRQKGEIYIPIDLPAGGNAEITARLHLETRVAIDTLRREYPEIFWMSLGEYEFEWQGSPVTGKGELRVYVSYRMTSEESDSMWAEIDGAIGEIVSGTPTDAASAVVYYHDRIAAGTLYDAELVNKRSERGYEYGFNADGPLLLGRAVCEGYAKAFKLLCDRAGIPCVVVLGQARGEDHCWNYVGLDGMWYLVDCTWDSGSSPSREYLLKGSQGWIDGGLVADIYRNDGAWYPEISASDYGTILFPIINIDSHLDFADN